MYTVACTVAVKAIPKAEAAGGGAKAQKADSAERPDMPSPGRSSSTITKPAGRGARPKDSLRRPTRYQSTWAATGAATDPRKPRVGPGAQSSRRRKRLHPPDGSSELPGTTEGGAPSLEPGTRVFAWRYKSPTCGISRFCELLGPWQRVRGRRKPATSLHGRRSRTWQEEAVALALWRRG